MATYRTKDGIVLRNVPDGTPEEQIKARIQQIRAQRDGGAPVAPRPDLKATNPAEYDPASPEYQAKYGATAGMSWGDKFTAGVGKSFVDTARGLGQLVGAVDQQTVDDAAARDQSLMQSGAGVTGDIAGQVAQFAVPGGAVSRTGGLLARVGRGAAFGAAIANTQPVTSDQTRAGNTVAGAVGGAAGEGIAAGIGRLANGASDKIAPNVAKLAKVAKEKWGIPLRAEQVTQSRPLQGISAALDTIPFSGRDAARKAQVAAWNRALSKTVGESDTNLTMAIQRAETNLGNKYDAVLRRNNVKVDSEFVQALDDALQTAKAELPEGQFGVIQRQVDEIMAKVQPGDTIPGQAAYNVKRVLDRIGRSKEPYAYHARTLKELADIGATFLVEPFGNSGTANRIFGQAVIGGTVPAAFIEPTAAVLGAGTVAAGRGTNALLQAQPVVNYALTGSNALRRAVPYANALLPATGAVLSQ